MTKHINLISALSEAKNDFRDALAHIEFSETTLTNDTDELVNIGHDIARLCQSIAARMNRLDAGRARGLGAEATFDAKTLAEDMLEYPFVRILGDPIIKAACALALADGREIDEQARNVSTADIEAVLESRVVSQ